MYLKELLNELDNNGVRVRSFHGIDIPIEIVEFYHFQDSLFYVRRMKLKTPNSFIINCMNIKTGKWDIMSNPSRITEIEEAREKLFTFMKVNVVINSLKNIKTQKNTLWDNNGKIIKEY